MNKPFSMAHWLIVACAFLLFPVLVCAQDIVAFNSPPDATEVAINTDQTVVLRWVRGGRPIVGGVIDISTTFGTLSTSTVTTDSTGSAAFTIKSTDIGNATVKAITDSADDELQLRFIDPGDAASPFGEFVISENPNGRMPMFVFKDRVGVYVRPSAQMSAVLDMAAAERLVFERELDERLFVLKVASVTNRLMLRQLNRHLEDDYEAVVQKAGLVAKLKQSRQWMVVPDEVIVEFHPGQTDADIDGVLDQFDDDKIRKSPYNSLRMVLPLRSSTEEDVFQVVARLGAADDLIRFIEPNYILAMAVRSPTLEPGFPWQWTLESNAFFGVEDADVDAAGAWDYSVGSHSTRIAIVDRGFEVYHADIYANLWTAANGFKGIDVVDGDNTNIRSTSTNPILYAHGTNVAGVAAMDGDNNRGYSGACPECLLIPVRTEQILDKVYDAFDAAIGEHAKIISNSWGFGGYHPGVDAALADATAAGVTVLFAMDNFDYDNCVGPNPDISCDPRVIGVSGVTDQDQRSGIDGQAMGYGARMDIMAPTAGGDQGIITTSVASNGGVISVFYINDFSGTSAATPLVAGIAGLMLDANANLTPRQIQRGLQDTADRVDPPAAYYSTEFGFSDPGGTPTYAYGRANALEAVRLVAPTATVSANHGPGKAGHDLLLRDHALDWGNTGRASNTIFGSPRSEIEYYKSVDIKVDADPFQSQPTTPQEFAALIPEEPEVGKRSRIYVRIRNRGPNTVDQADLKVITAVVGDTYPPLPTDFWTNFNNPHTDTTNWQPLARLSTEDVEYSGASLAGCPGRTVPECLPGSAVDLAQIAMFTVAAMNWDPAVHKGPAFFAVLQSGQDQAQGLVSPAASSLLVLEHVNNDNNVTLWTSGPTGPVAGVCEAGIVGIAAFLVVVAVLLLIYVVIRWLSGQTVAVLVYVILIVALVLLLWICMFYPGCIEQALRDYFRF